MLARRLRGLDVFTPAAYLSYKRERHVRTRAVCTPLRTCEIDRGPSRAPGSFHGSGDGKLIVED
jgi:hypothetical protein